MGKDSTMYGCADVQMRGFNQHLNMGLVGKVALVKLVVLVESVIPN